MQWSSPPFIGLFGIHNYTLFAVTMITGQIVDCPMYAFDFATLGSSRVHIFLCFHGWTWFLLWTLLTDVIDTFAAPIPPESSDSPVDPTATSPAVDSPPFSQRPVVVPSSAIRSSHVSVAAVTIVLSIAASIFVWLGCGVVGCMQHALCLCGLRRNYYMDISISGIWAGLWSLFCTVYYK